MSTRVLPSSFKWLSFVDLCHFCGKVKFLSFDLLSCGLMSQSCQERGRGQERQERRERKNLKKTNPSIPQQALCQKKQKWTILKILVYMYTIQKF